MKKSRFTEEQIAYALKQAELGMTVGEICRKMGVAEATFTFGARSTADWGRQS